jgi:ABC-type transport system substrate-binding protein
MEVSEGAAFIDAVVSGDYEAAYFSFGMEHPFQDNAFVLLPGGPLNVLDTDDPEIAAWNLEAASLPEEEAAEIYRKINKKVVEEAWVLVTHFQDSVLLTNDRVSGMEPYVSQDSMSIYNWRIED